MNALTKENKSLIVAVLYQNLIKVYRLLSKPEDPRGNTLTPTGRNDLKLFASELCRVLLALEIPLEDIERTAARFGLNETA
jgi:hypothetical protein